MAYPQLSNQFNNPVINNLVNSPGFQQAGQGPMMGPATQGRKWRTFVTVGDRKPGFRVPSIDRKLQALCERVTIINVDDQEHCMIYAYVPGDVAIEVLGKYNPLFAKRPKKLAAKLLACTVPSRKFWNMDLVASGLTYDYPELTGIRAARQRTSAAGIALLQFWNKTFPKFRPFYDAYVDEKDVCEIKGECFDMYNGLRPMSFREIDKKNIQNRVKWEARQFRILQKQREQERQRDARQVFNDQYMNQSYAQQQALINSPYANAVQQAMQDQMRYPFLPQSPLLDTDVRLVGGKTITGTMLMKRIGKIFGDIT